MSPRWTARSSSGRAADLRSEARQAINEELSDVLSEFARTMVSDFPIQRILDHLVKRIVEVLPITAAGVTLISAELDLRYVAASNRAALRFEKLQTELGEGPCLAAFRAGTAISVPDLSGDKRFPNFSPRALRAGLAAVFTFPLNHGDLRLGALDLYRDSPGPLSPDAMSAAQTLADVAAAYLINAQARSDLQDTSDRSRHAALHDGLTGLPNRILLLERLEHAFLRGRRTTSTSAVFMVDLNGFKAVNDSYGHGVGDELLVGLTERLTEVVRPGDTLARLAGDEFVILCEDLADSAQADAIGVRVQAALARPFALSSVEVYVTASIGIAFLGHGIESPEQLLRDADLAMYQAKRNRESGRNVFELSELQLAENQANLLSALPGAAERGELALAYQPIVAAADGHVTAVEALLRWTHPSRGLVSPSVLVPLAEQCGLIGEIGSWVLEQACADRTLWQRGQAEDIAVSVNVSSHQFMSPGFAESVAAVLDSAATAPDALTLEVTESVFVRDGARALLVRNQLRRLGVKVALDDFGTGYSSPNHLVRFLVDTVKVDRAFATKLESDPASVAVVNAIIALAHDLGMPVVSEGVETAEQHRELSRLGCDYCQGYYFAKPMPSADITTLIQLGDNRTNPRLPALRTLVNPQTRRDEQW